MQLLDVRLKTRITCFTPLRRRRSGVKQVILVFKRTSNNCITWIDAFSICLFYIYHCGVKKIVFFSIIIGLKRIEKLNYPKPKSFDLQFFAAPPNHFILNCKKFFSMHIQHSTDDSATYNCFAVSLLELIKFRQVPTFTLNPTGKKPISKSQKGKAK